MTAPVYYFVPSLRLSVRLHGDDRDLAVVTEEELASLTPTEAEKRLSQNNFFETMAMPNRLRLERNNFYEADELEVTIPFLHLPIDPGIIRALRIELYGELIEAEAFGDGIATGCNRPGAIQNEYNLLFTGYVDEPEAELLSKRGELTLMARDYQALLEDTPMRPSLAAKLDEQWQSTLVGMLVGNKSIGEAFANAISGQPAADFVRVILAAYPALRSIKVESVGDAGSREIHRSSAMRTRDNESSWEYMQRRLLFAGVIPYLWHDTIYLVDSGDIWTERPFGWKFGSGESVNTVTGRLEDSPLFIVGHNVIDPKISRELSRASAPPVEVRMFEPGSIKTHSATWPPRAARRWVPERVTVEGGDSAPRVVNIDWDPDLVDQLAAIAKTLHIEHGQKAAGIEFETHDYSSAGLDPSLGDLLFLSPGDPIQLLHKTPDAADPEKGGVPDDFSRIAGMDAIELSQHLVSLGYDSKMAMNLAYTMTKGLPDTLKCSGFTFDWDAERPGASFAISASPYMEAETEAGVELPEAAEMEPTVA